MSEFVCSICGFSYEGLAAPEKCPICKAPSSRFSELEKPMSTDIEEIANHENLQDPVEKEIIAQFNKQQNNLTVIKWYKDTYNVGLKEAKDKVESVLSKHNLWDSSKTGNGCAVTIMIAITTTLSLFWLL